MSFRSPLKDVDQNRKLFVLEGGAAETSHLGLMCTHSQVGELGDGLCDAL